ncbi:MAG TPA: hypothetical protein VK939_06905 [Longimicrobiales bacterium]|nr:hypothetical protein [Longimicrobiales bacterium]
MGATILRWFWRDGVRYRAYFRSVDGAVGRELVVAAGSASCAIPAPKGMALDEMPEAQLLALAEALSVQVVASLAHRSARTAPAASCP